jgi:hypothetical protein
MDLGVSSQLSSVTLLRFLNLRNMALTTYMTSYNTVVFLQPPALIYYILYIDSIHSINRLNPLHPVK